MDPSLVGGSSSEEDSSTYTVFCTVRRIAKARRRPYCVVKIWNRSSCSDAQYRLFFFAMFEGGVAL